MKKKLLSLLTAALFSATMILPSLTVNAKNVSDYTDVGSGAWYYPYVADVSAKGLMTGTNESTFTPTANLERGQFATVLYRMYQSPATNYERRFADVPDGYFYSLPVTWANNMQIVTGYENGLFGTTDYITREQMATMLYRYSANTGGDVSASADYSYFPDASKVSVFARDAVRWAVGAEIISGDNGNINPQGKVSRAVCATMIARFTGYTKTPETNNGTPTTGQKNALSSAKAYLDIMPFSYSDLIGQLKYDGYSTEDATYAVDNCGANWNEQAALSAKAYLDIMSFSRQELIDQLLYDGFTAEQAEYGVTAAGY
ncbi:MAG: Ltp family lipoprotein [Muricomes sp.]